MKKSGVTAVQTLASIIIVLIGAGIILYFLAYLPYKEEISKQACHQSVILRSKSIAGLKPGQALVPLNCKTEEIVIKTTDEERIKKEIANAMYDCWWMLGEGKLNFFSRGWTKDVYCVICSRIKFDEKVQEKIKKINDLDSYLQNTKIPKHNITYAEYFTTEKAPQIAKESPVSLDTDKEYLLVYALIERTAAPERIVGIASAIGILILTRGKGNIGLGSGILKGGLAFGAYKAGSWLAGKVHNWIVGSDSDYYVAFGLIEADAEEIKNFGCERVESIP